MLFRQFVDEDLGCASYLVGDADAGEAVLIDPAYAIEPYLAEAERHGVRIVRVLETHTHADHVSGHGRLALEHGIPVSVHARRAPSIAHDPLADGDEIAVGAVTRPLPSTRPATGPSTAASSSTARCLPATRCSSAPSPGPTSPSRPARAPRASSTACTGCSSSPTTSGVFPGHVAGSLCGTGMSSDPSTTIGAERRGNPLLAIATVTEFVDETAGGATPRPPNMERIVELNRGPFLAASPAPAPVAIAGRRDRPRRPHRRRRSPRATSTAR